MRAASKFPPTAEVRYRNRAEAGAALARALERYRGEHPVVLGIPRGGVPVAAAVARALGGELDVAVARKLGAPMHEELAVGAVTADGGRFLNQDVIDALGVSEEYLSQITEEQMGEARSREQRFRGGRPPAPLGGRTVILVDDGLATGATMRAAARSVLARGPARLIVAVPVGAAATCAAL
ncbi:MAG TPA: phosphoribosyltransferase family protein, partial [Gemmatimonadales bacterium]